MKKLFAKIILITSPQPTLWDKARYVWDVVLHFAPVAIALDLFNWWFSENRQFGQFMCIALIINLLVGIYFHLKMGSFNFKAFLFKNVEMIAIVTVVYVMLEMLRYTAGDNIAGEIFKITIQVVTLLYPTSKVMKNVYIITDGKYPPEFIMNKLYNFEKNGDLSDFFKNKKDDKNEK